MDSGCIGAVGGGVAGGLVADADDIGTWGDWLFEPGHYSSKRIE